MYTLSFCIPTYNRSDAVNGLVHKLLSNPCKEFQVVVCDNASTDDTVERLRTIKDSRLKLVVNPCNIGAKLNWYRVLEEGEGKWLYFVIGRDMLNPGKIDKLVEFLKKISKTNIKLLMDGPWVKGVHEGMVRIYSGIEAAKVSLNTKHPTGLIYEREMYRSIPNRKKYFMYSGTYPENYIKRDFIVQSVVAKIPIYVYEGKVNINRIKDRSKYEDNTIPYYYPSKRVEEYIHILNMILDNKKVAYSEEEYDEFFVQKCVECFSKVSYAFRDEMKDPGHIGHYGHKLRYVNKAEMMGNVLKAYKTITRYYRGEMSFERRWKVRKAMLKSLKSIILEKK